MKQRKTRMRYLKIGDRFKFINHEEKTIFTLLEKISGYCGEFLFPWIILDSQCSDTPFTPCYRITAEYKKGSAPHRHSYTENYTVLKILDRK
jgi:hypothetical protein